MYANENLSEVWAVKVSDLAFFVNPMRDDVWECGVIKPADVHSCWDTGFGEDPAEITENGYDSWEYNVARIAWLAENGWDSTLEDPDPITIHSRGAMSGYDPVVIIDGNHRFSAAIILGLEYISVMATGDTGYLSELLRPLATA